MTDVVRKFAAISFALLMLSSSMGLAVSTHLCGNRAVESKLHIGITHVGCPTADGEKGCENRSSHSGEVRQKPCCENTYTILWIDGMEEVRLAAETVNPIFLTAFVHSLTQALAVVQTHGGQYAHYSPPLLNQDIQVLFQSFLI